MNSNIIKISVILPTFNSGEFLDQSIKSIINQTFPDFELIIIDDGSIDNTHTILKQYSDDRIILVQNQKRLGLPESLNKGISLARSELIARMDADDIAHPDRLKKQYAFLEKNPECAVVGSLVKFINQKNRIIGKWSQKYTPEQIYYNLHFNNIFAHSSIMARKNVLFEVDLYNPDKDKAEDFDLWKRVSQKYTICIIPEYLLNLRLHQSSVSSVNLDKQLQVADTIVKERLEELTGSYLSLNIIFLLRSDYSGFNRNKGLEMNIEIAQEAICTLIQANEKIIHQAPERLNKDLIEKEAHNHLIYTIAFSSVKLKFRDFFKIIRDYLPSDPISGLRVFFLLVVMKNYYSLRNLITR